ncbi:hypothetical protein I4U23_019991 [Adineta vaga]|nr:hypothetical protein I4U23_019991 [Adineta vaga]
MQPHNISRIIAFISIAFSAIALLLACVGIGTPNWQSTYQYSSGSAQRSSTNNFFYACSFFTNGSLNQCLNRDGNLFYYDSPFSGLYTSANDTSVRLQNAAGLSVIGIIFIAFGIVATLIMAVVSLSAWMNLIAPILLFLACLFMLAGLAEGARIIVFNDYSADLYITAHLLTIFSFGICTLAAGRFHFEQLHGSK